MHEWSCMSCHIVACYASTMVGDDILRRLWELEEIPKTNTFNTPEENADLHYYQHNHTKTPE